MNDDYFIENWEESIGEKKFWTPIELQKAEDRI